MWINLAFLILIMVIVLSISWTTIVGAPWVPTPLGMVRKMLEMAEVGPEDLVYDLGCGDGRMIITAARRYGARAVGIELDPLRYLWCQLMVTFLGLRGQVQVIYGDFFRQNLSEADVVTCYLLQTTNRRLQDKLKQELNPQARVISNTFTFPELRLVELDEKGELYLYRLGE